MTSPLGNSVVYYIAMIGTTGQLCELAKAYYILLVLLQQGFFQYGIKSGLQMQRNSFTWPW